MTSVEHDKGVAAAKEWLEGQGYTLKDNPTIGNSIPDAYGEKTEEGSIAKALAEVETSDSITGEAAKEQMNDFAKWAAEYSTRQAVLFVPKGHVETAKKELPKYNEYYEF